MGKAYLTVLGLAMAAFLSGCNSYRIVQTNHFANDDGAIVRVDYGRAEKDHVNTYIAPGNRREMEFKSKLVVEVTLPDGDDFTAWQCMNFVNRGTMYRTDNEEWVFLANGFTCEIYQKDENDPKKRMREVFRGVLCNMQEKTVEKDTRWRKLKRDVGKRHVAQ